jgi:2,4-dienoyl-CoA reductase-like NADH-dependent reductase (Old Yellow Enzyme family)
MDTPSYEDAAVRPAATGAKALFQPFQLGPLSLRNRVVMSAMTRYFSPDGVPGDDVAAYYARRASEVGLIITEGAFVGHPSAGFHPRVPRFYGEDALAGWSRVRQAVHAAGGLIMPQLWHVGVQSQPGDVADPAVPPLSASGLLGPGRRVGAPMTDAEIEAVIEAFAEGAEAACRLGFDGIELHGAHGYLIDSFLWRGSNARDDAYGGGLVAVTRFAARIVEACRRRTRPDFPILFRFSQWKNVDFDARLAETPEELAALLAPLVKAGVDLFDCSTRRFWSPAFEGSPLTLAGWTRRLTGKPVMAVGSVGMASDLFASLAADDTEAAANIGQAARLIETGEADLIAVGRGLLADPDWVDKVRRGRADDLTPFRRDALATLI